MFDSTLKNSLPRTVEPRRFATQGAVLSGFVPCEDLQRLGKSQVSAIRVVATLQFAIDEQREKVVTGLIEATVQMQCQRCLEAVEIELSCPVSSAMVWDEEDAKHLPGTLDPWVVKDESADLYDMIEDEILLNLPYVAFHEWNCVDPALLSAGEVDAAPEAGADENNPFQVLEQLKGKTKE